MTKNYNSRINLIRSVSLWLLAAVFMLSIVFGGASLAWAKPEDIGGEDNTDYVLTVGSDNLIAARLKGQAAYAGQDTSALCEHNGGHVGDGAGAGFQFDLYDANFTDGAYVVFDYDRTILRDGFWYAGNNDDFQAITKFFPGKAVGESFEIRTSGGSFHNMVASAIHGDVTKFMVKGYTYRVLIDGESNSFIAYRKPITADESYFEEIVRFEMNATVQALNVYNRQPLATYPETYAYFGTIGTDAKMVVDNVSMWRPNDKDNTTVAFGFDGNLKFDSYPYKLDDTNHPDLYGNTWEKYSATDDNLPGKRMGWYYNDASLTPSQRIYLKCSGFTEANLTDESSDEWSKINDRCDVSEKTDVGGTNYTASLTVTYKNHPQKGNVTFTTYNGGVVPYLSLPAGYKYQKDGADYTSDGDIIVTENMEITAVRDTSYVPENVSGNITVLGTSADAYSVAARLEGSTGACIEFDLIGTDFFTDTFVNMVKDVELGASRLFTPNIAFYYGHKFITGLGGDALGNGDNWQNYVQFFPDGKFQVVCWGGNPVPIEDSMVDGDASLFMQKGYSYRVEMRDADAEEFANCFVVSRKEIWDEKDCYKKILSFDMPAPVTETSRTVNGKSYVGMYGRTSNNSQMYELTIDNVWIGRSVDDPNAAACDFETEERTSVKSGTVEGWDTYSGPDWQDMSYITYKDKATGEDSGIVVLVSSDTDCVWDYKELAHTLTFTVDGESWSPLTVKVYDGAIYHGPKEAGYTFTWTKASGDDVDFDNITGSASYTGVKAKAQFTVTYNPSGNGCTGTIDPVTVDAGSTVTLNGSGYTRTGFTLDGWATSVTGSKVYDPNETITVNENLNLYPIWKRNVYKVDFVVDGEVVETHQVSHGNYVSFEGDEPTKEGYEFKGWDFDFEENPITEAKTITAQFEKIGGEGGGCGGCGSAIMTAGTGIAAGVVILLAAVFMVVRRKRNAD